MQIPRRLLTAALSLAELTGAEVNLRNLIFHKHPQMLLCQITLEKYRTRQPNITLTVSSVRFLT